MGSTIDAAAAKPFIHDLTAPHLPIHTLLDLRRPLSTHALLTFLHHLRTFLAVGSECGVRLDVAIHAHLDHRPAASLQSFRAACDRFSRLTRIGRQGFRGRHFLLDAGAHHLVAEFTNLAHTAIDRILMDIGPRSGRKAQQQHTQGEGQGEGAAPAISSSL